MVLDEIKKVMLEKKDNVFHSEGDITYEKLYIYITRLYSYLNTINKRSGKIIIYGHKNINFIVSMLACAYSGFTYIPIDKYFCKERKQDIIEVINPDLIINTTNEKIVESSKEILAYELEEILKSSTPKIELTTKLKPEDIYYIIFTSGSTGKPKGVKVTYKNLDVFCDRIIKKNSIGEDSVVLNQALFSFDLSVADIYMTLLAGARYVMLSSDEIKEYKKMYEKMKENSVGIIVATPSFIDYLLIDKTFNSNNFKYLKTIFTCGEKLNLNTVKKVKERFKNITFINSYGPTECTVAVTSIEVDEKLKKIPAGNYLDNSFCIVDDNFNKVDTKGNILIYGDFVSNGYINYPNTSFVEFESKKAYLTGDIGYIEDDKLYYLYRKDRQVKLNGYRVELGEIENKINNIDTVEKCVVIDKKNEEGKVIKIVAYIITKDSKQVIKEKLRNTISNYMFPEIKIVEELPVNENYKIDIKEIKEEENERKNN